MCLISSEKRTKVAETDIPCIKIMQKKAKGYRTPYKHMYVKKDIMDGKKPFGSLPEHHIKGRRFEPHRQTLYGLLLFKILVPDMRYEYNENLIHSYTGSNIDFDLDTYRGFEIFDCVIPKGTEYVEGVQLVQESKFNITQYKSYASSQIVFVGPHKTPENENI